MSVLRRSVAIGGGLALALIAAPLSGLKAQVTAPGTNPQPTTNPPTTANPGTTSNPNPTPNPTPTTSASGQTVDREMQNDLPFLRQAAGSNLMEVTLGRLATTRATSARVKNFAQRMVSDHSSLQQQLTSLSSSNGVDVSATLTPQQQQEVSRLQRLSGTEFDQAYIRLMVQNHQMDVANFQEQSRQADSPRVRELATRALPTLRQHLTSAQEVAREINVDVATNPGGGQNGQGGSSQADVRADRKFIREVAADNMLEISLGELAAQRAQNVNVKRFAQRIVADHRRQQDAWMSMVARNDQEMTPGMGKNHRKKLEKLQKVSGREFDRAFMTQMVQDHKDYIDYFEREGRSAHSSQVRQLVERDLPGMKNHFTQAKQIGAQVGADTSAELRSERSKT
jgi:putative membrane protein